MYGIGNVSIPPPPPPPPDTKAKLDCELVLAQSLKESIAGIGPIFESISLFLDGKSI